MSIEIIDTVPRHAEGQERIMSCCLTCTRAVINRGLALPSSWHSEQLLVIEEGVQPVGNVHGCIRPVILATDEHNQRWHGGAGDIGIILFQDPVMGTPGHISEKEITISEEKAYQRIWRRFQSASPLRRDSLFRDLSCA